MKVPSNGAVSINAGRSSPARIVVLGGCGGIGQVLVETLTAQACDVSVLDLPASIERHRPAASVATIAVNATSTDEVNQAATSIADRLGAIDGLVYLTGYMPPLQALSDTPPAVLRASLETNLLTATTICSALMPLLLKGSNSSVVLAASGLGAYARPGMGSYSIAKAGIIAVTRQLALENAPVVRVNAVAPAAVDTAFLRGGTGRSDENEPPHVDVDQYQHVVPLGRIAEPLDVTGPIEFLLSGAARYMTGQTLFINGGTYTG